MLFLPLITLGQVVAEASQLPVWAIAALTWSNGFLIATLIAFVIRQRGIETIKAGLEAQITGARTAIEEKVRSTDAVRGVVQAQIEGRLDRTERELFGPDGLKDEVKRVGAGVDSLVRLFLRHGEKMGIDPADIRALEEHR